MTFNRTIPILGLAVLLAACQPAADDEATESEGALGAPAAAHLARLQKLMTGLSLRADQRATLETMVRDLATKLEPARKLRAEVVAEVARQLRAGKVERARLEALLRKGEALHAALQPTLLGAMNNLHRNLDAGQRARLVDQLEKRRGWRHGQGHGHGLRALRELARKLKLSDDQLDRIQAAVKEATGGMGERLSRMVKLYDQLEDAKQAFKGDRFNAADLEILKAVPGLVRGRIESAIKAAEKILPILSAEQRAAAAGLLEEHARKRGVGR